MSNSFNPNDHTNKTRTLKTANVSDEVQDLSALTLPELETIFARELEEADHLLAEADCLSRRSTVSLYRAGRVLSAIKAKLKLGGNWTKWQKDHKVGVTSAWQAIQLFERSSEGAVSKLTRTQALIKFNITKPKPASVAKGVTTRKCDKKVAPEKGIKLFACDSQEVEEQPTTDDAPVVQPQKSPEPEIPATEPEAPAQPETTEATIPSQKAMEYLHKINVKLEELERGLTGFEPDDHILSLINQAIATLQRLRGDVPADIDAA